MKLLLIKIGKAWHTLRREGLFRGGRRVLTAALSLFAPVAEGDVLIVSGGVGDSARYRARHVAEELRAHGIRASVTVQDNPFLVSYARRFRVFVFQRVLFVPRVALLVTQIKGRGGEFLFETDDLVYDPQYLEHMDYFQKMNALERKLYEHGVGGEILRDPALAACTVTTSFLAEKLRTFGKPVFIVPNRLAADDMRIVRCLRRLDQPAAGVVRVGYFSGTASHDKDFATITKPLAALLSERPEVRLVIAGPLVLDSAFAPFQDRIERLPFVDRERHFRNIASVDINLAPLEIGNPFCEAKSELKFIEAGAVGVPTIASATRTFREAITNGEDGLVAVNDDDWHDALMKLVTDRELRQRMGGRAAETVERRYVTTAADNTAYYEFLKSKITE